MPEHQSVQPFPPEFRLVLACCRPKDPPEIEPLLPLVDWNLFLSLAEAHGCIAFAYHNLAAYADRVPVWPELQERFVATTKRSLWLTDLLLKVLDGLRSRGIEALPYKGPVLSQMLYGDIALRQYTDLDVFIRAADMSAVKDAMLEIGLTPHLQLTRVQEKAYVASGYELAFDGFGAVNAVEAQWRVLPRFYAVDFHMEAFFQRAQSVELNGAKVRTLSNEDLFLVLCVHAAKHLWGRLSWIADIVGLSDVGSLDWNLVHQQAEMLGIQRILAITSLVVRSLFGIELPFGMMSHEAESTAGRILRRLASAEEIDTESPGYFREILRTRERRSDRLKFFWRLAITPSVSDWEAVRLPDFMFPLYRVVRLGRVMGKIC